MVPYIANTESDVREMLSAIGVRSIDALFTDIKPHHTPKSFVIPDGKSECEVIEVMRRLANQNNIDLIPFIGGGYYDHYVPAAVSALASRGEFYTAYTPYQPECAQGTLQALYEYQSSICALTGMEVANASMYDGGTALYEAAMMAIRITGRTTVLVDSAVSPIYQKIIRSYTSNLQYNFKLTPVAHGQSDRDHLFRLLDDDTAAIVLQNPNFFGAIDDHSDIVVAAHKKGALVIESVYPISLAMIKTPAEMGVDIVTGEGQSLGLPLHFGGPYLGFMATSKKYARKMPGRIVGETVDRQGRRCFVNTLQAREQHIRREKATSNICTNAALCAIQASMFMSLVGKQGMVKLADVNYQKAEYAKSVIGRIPGVEVKKSALTFNEFTIHVPVDASDVVARMIEKGFAAGFPLGRYYPDMKQYMIIAVTEKRTKDEIDRYAKSLAEVVAELTSK